MSYRVGLPGWRIAARVGLPVKLRVAVLFDEEAKVWVAHSDDLRGLNAEAATLDELAKNIFAAAADLLKEEHIDKSRPRIRLDMPADLCMA